MKLGSITLATGACVLAILAFAMGAEADEGTWSTFLDSCSGTYTADDGCPDDGGGLNLLDLQGATQACFSTTIKHGPTGASYRPCHTASSVDIRGDGFATSETDWCKVEISFWIYVDGQLTTNYQIHSGVSGQGDYLMQIADGAPDPHLKLRNDDLSVITHVIPLNTWVDIQAYDLDCSTTNRFSLKSSTLGINEQNLRNYDATMWSGTYTAAGIRTTYDAAGAGANDLYIDSIKYCVSEDCTPFAATTTKASATDPWAAVKTNHDPDNPLVYARYSYDGEDGARGHMVLMGEDLVNDATVNFCPDTTTGADDVPYDEPGALGVDGQGVYAYSSCTRSSVFGGGNFERWGQVDAGTLTYNDAGILSCKKGNLLSKYDALGGQTMAFLCNGQKIKVINPEDRSTDWSKSVNVADLSADTVAKVVYTITATTVAAYNEAGTALGSFLSGGEHIAAYDDVVFIIDGNRLERWTTTGSPAETHSYTLTDSGSRNGGLDTTKDGTYIFAQDNDKFCLWLAADLSLVACYTIPDVSGTNAVQDYDVDFLNTYAYVATEDEIVQFDIAFATSAWGTTNNTFPTGTTNPGGASGSTGLIGAGNSPDPNQGAADQCEGDPTFLGLDICSGIDADGDGSAEVSGTAFAWLIGFLSLTAWTGAFFFLGRGSNAPILGAVGALGGLIFNVAFNLWPFWVVVFVFMLGAAALALKFRGGGS